MNLIKDEVSECACGIEGDCISKDVVKKIAADLNISEKNFGEQAKIKLNCLDNKCILRKMTRVVGDKIVDDELKMRFKPSGPRSTRLLNDKNIDDILQQWARQFKDFFAYNFNMANYEKFSWRNHKAVEEPDTLATINWADLYKKGYRCSGCVINSDVYQGQGIHWMALFVDTRDDEKWSVEFFNSSGNAPKTPWASWMVKTQYQLGSIKKGINIKLVSSRIQHQRSKSECGVYSLFYIWCRLNKVPYKYFNKAPISDVMMFKFRQQLFEDDEYKHMKKFNYDEYKKITTIKWADDERL
ncbi:MAG: Ulp1 family isopeptidase [Acidimicrobiales bacterium]